MLWLLYDVDGDGGMCFGHLCGVVWCGAGLGWAGGGREGSQLVPGILVKRSSGLLACLPACSPRLAGPVLSCTPGR
jgi:hypothetical protein